MSIYGHVAAHVLASLGYAGLLLKAVGVVAWMPVYVYYSLLVIGCVLHLWVSLRRRVFGRLDSRAVSGPKPANRLSMFRRR